MQGYIETAEFNVPTQDSQSVNAQPEQDPNDPALVASALVTDSNSPVSIHAIADSSAQNLAPVQYIILSRRSRDRAGLRYQRRGIDDESRVANFVETETIMKVEVSNTWVHFKQHFMLPPER